MLVNKAIVYCSTFFSPLNFNEIRWKIFFKKFWPNYWTKMVKQKLKKWLYRIIIIIRCCKQREKERKTSLISINKMFSSILLYINSEFDRAIRFWFRNDDVPSGKKDAIYVIFARKPIFVKSGKSMVIFSISKKKCHLLRPIQSLKMLNFFYWL